jgi:hypothetical protein
MPLNPKVPKDLALAPLAAGIDLNLQRLRDRSPDEIAFELALELDDQEGPETTEADRAERVLRVALRDVDLHHWHAEITGDGARLRLSGGSVSLDLGLSASILAYIGKGGTGTAAD